MIVQDARKLEFLTKFDALRIGPYIIKNIFNNSLI